MSTYGLGMLRAPEAISVARQVEQLIDADQASRSRLRSAWASSITPLKAAPLFSGTTSSGVDTGLLRSVTCPLAFCEIWLTVASLLSWFCTRVKGFSGIDSMR